jgi:hypothetical protein
MSENPSKLKEVVDLIRSGEGHAFNAMRRLLGDQMPSLHGQTFNNIQMVGFDLSELDLSNTEWEASLFNQVRFDGSSLEGAYIKSSSLIACSLIGVEMDDVALDGCIIKRTALHQCSIEGAEVSDTQWSDCALSELDLSGSEWSSVVFNAGQISHIKGDGTLSGWTLREVALNSFETGDMEVDHCTIAPHPEQPDVIPEGFTRLTGRRRRL